MHAAIFNTTHFQTKQTKWSRFLQQLIYYKHWILLWCIGTIILNLCNSKWFMLLSSLCFSYLSVSSARLNVSIVHTPQSHFLLISISFSASMPSILIRSESVHRKILKSKVRKEDSNKLWLYLLCSGNMQLSALELLFPQPSDLLPTKKTWVIYSNGGQ